MSIKQLIVDTFIFLLLDFVMRDGCSYMVNIVWVLCDL